MERGKWVGGWVVGWLGGWVVGGGREREREALLIRISLEKTRHWRAQESSLIDFSVGVSPEGEGSRT
jgi:hypothetical protein